LHHINSYTLIPNNESTVGANNQRYDGMIKLRYRFDPRASIAYTGNAYHNSSDGKSTDITGTGYDYAVSHDSTQTHALTGEFLPTSTTAVQARLYEARFDSNSAQNPIDENNNLGPQFDYGNLYERYHRADVTVSQQAGSWQFLQGGDEWVQNSYRGLNRLVGNDNGQQITTNDVWLQDRIQPMKNLIVNLGGRWIPGQKVKFHMGNLIARTYTPTTWNPVDGTARLLIFLHGAGPGSKWAASLKKGGPCQFIGPRNSLNFREIKKPVVFFGDETSLGAAHALHLNKNGSGQNRYIFEVSSLVESEEVVRYMGLADAQLIQRLPDDIHLKEVEELLSSAILHQGMPCGIFTGKAQSIQAVRKLLRARRLLLSRLEVKAYWAQGKIGLD
jgi:NADPH-dependent ferric siderophore reductase